jgi:hypothetical protein
MVSVRLPCAYAGAASVAAAAVAPTPTVELFKKERRSIKSPPDFFVHVLKSSIAIKLIRFLDCQAICRADTSSFHSNL